MMISLKKVCLLPMIVLLALNATGQISFPEIDGWKKSDTRKYDSETLWEYINGAADYYLKYGFILAEIVEYSLSENEYIKAEVYQHKSALDAFGIYAYERPPETDYLKIGTEGYIEHSALNYYDDHCYIKIHSHQSDGKTINAIKTIANQIGRKNFQGKGFKTPFKGFPADSRVTNSDKYFPSNYLGHQFLHSVLEVTYEESEDQPKLFMISCENTDEPLSILKSYFSFSKMQGSPNAKEIYEINDMFNGPVLITFHKRSVFGVHNTENIGLAKKHLMSLLRMNIEENRNF